MTGLLDFKVQVEMPAKDWLKLYNSLPEDTERDRRIKDVIEDAVIGHAIEHDVREVRG